VDLIELVDLDEDGDLDLLANNEEWWEDAGGPPRSGRTTRPRSRGPLVREPAARASAPGLAGGRRGHGPGGVYTDATDGSWTTRSRAGSTGSTTPYVQATDVVDDGPARRGARARVRPSRPGRAASSCGGASASPGVGDRCRRRALRLGLGRRRRRAAAGARRPGRGERVALGPPRRPVTLAAGEHLLRLGSREGGVRVDQLVIAPRG